MREATIKVSLQDAILTRSIPVAQYGTAKLTHTNKLDFKVRESSEHINITDCNVDWRVFVQEGVSWLKVESPEAMTGMGNSTITLHADFNPDTENNRTANVYIRYLGPRGDSITSRVPITQDRSPITPTSIELLEMGNSNVVEATIGETATMTINTIDFDNQDKWLFTWFVNGDSIQSSKSNVFSYENLTNKIPYKIDVKLSYEDAPSYESLQNSMSFILYPAPKNPTGLEKKGLGKSGIMIATVDTLSDTTLKKLGYKFVFGSDGSVWQSDSIPNRYCQYRNSADVKDDNINKWVYTLWDIETRNGIPGRTVKSTMRYNTKGSPTPVKDTEERNSSSPESAPKRITLTRGRLTAHVDDPTEAVVIVTALTGQRHEVLRLEPRTDFDEQIELGSLPAGVYVIKVTIGDQQTEEKIIVK